MVCDRRGGGSDCGKSRALVITFEIEEHSPFAKRLRANKRNCATELTP